MSLFSGRYLFHVHTPYTDGTITVAEYFEHARRLGLERIIFLEHIRLEPRYDVARFVEEVRRASVDAGIPASVGFEAKLLPNGSLDIADEHFQMADVVGIAEHSFPEDFPLLKRTFETVLAERSGAGAPQQLVWVHPGLWLHRRKLMEQHWADYLDMLDLAARIGIKIERNRRYGLLPEALIDRFDPSCIVTGHDAHRPADLAGD